MGIGDKRFSVLIHSDGKRYLERDVEANSVERLIRTVEERLSRRLLDIMFFNPYSNDYQPLTANDFNTIPRNLELQATLTTLPVRQSTVVHNRGRVGVRGTADEFEDAAAFSGGDLSAGGGEGSGIRAGRNPTGGRGITGRPQHSREGSRGRSHSSALADDPNPRFRDGTHTTTFKARVVEHVRSLALPLFNVGRITKDELVACCADVSEEFFHRRSVEEKELHSFRRELSLQERDLLRVMVKAYNADQYGTVKEELGKGRARSLARRGQKAPDMATPRSRLQGVSSGRMGGRTDYSDGDRGGQYTPPRGRQRSPRQHTRESYGGGDGYYHNPRNNNKRTYSPPVPPDVNEEMNDTAGGGGYGGGYQSTPNTSPPRGDYSPSPPNNTSVFSSVSYTVAGTFPHLPHGRDNIGDSALRVNLQPPTVSDPDQDVVIVGTLQSYSPVSLCWWLAYGPQKLVLNLDRMYSSHFVTTFQISENSFVLTFRAGSLVPGWQYHVHVTVTSSRGTTSMAQATFLVPTQGGEAGPQQPAMIGSMSPNNNKRPYGDMVQMAPASFESTGMMTSPIKRYGQGYHGDNEGGGWLSRDGIPPPAIGSQANHAGSGQSDLGGAAGIGALVDSKNNRSDSPESFRRQMMPGGGDIPRSGKGVSTSAAATVGDVSATTGSQQGGGLSSVADMMSSAGGGGAPGGNSYHEQLKHFFSSQIEPLYFLSPNPSMSEQQFRNVIKDVAKRYWLRHSPETQLSDDIKKAIVLEVKAEIGKARTVVDATPAHSPMRSIMN